MRMDCLRGRINGEYIHRIHTISNMFQKNIPAENCADLLDEDSSFVNKIYRLCQAHPEWSEEDIQSALNKK